jgi:hypothetical protein
MNEKVLGKLLAILNPFSACLVLAGAFMKLSHILYGDLLLTWGFILSVVFSSWEINRLKKIIRNYKDPTTEKISTDQPS